MKRLFRNLTFQVIIAIILGVLAGVLLPEFATTAKLISGTFIKLINMLIAPIVFLTIVLGIARMGDMKKVGRVGGKALLYFEIITTVAIVIGLLVANILQPGKGVKPLVSHDTAAKAGSIQANEINWAEFLTHIVPQNIFEAFSKGDILQILFFAILFAIGISRMGQSGHSLLNTFDKISHALFNVMKMVMKLAPLGAFGGMAFTVGTYGLQTLLPMAKIMGSIYLTCFLFIFGVLNAVCKYFNISLLSYLKYIRRELLIVFGTSSSESVLPSMMQRMEKFGCSKSVVGLVIPTGYSFNLDGTSIYLSMAFIFLAQVFNIELTLGQQLTAIGILMVTSKGAAGVTGSGFIVLSSTLAAMKIMPVENVAILLGVDRFMSEARALTNLVGNGIATIVVAKSEGEFDESRYLDAIKSGAATENAEEEELPLSEAAPGLVISPDTVASTK